MTKRLLSKFGHIVDEAVDGKEFLQKMGEFNLIKIDDNNNNISAEEVRKESGEEVQFDVILMDDNMPNLCGPEATLIARQRGYKGIIFGVTGNTQPDQVKHFLDHGADQIFDKPLNLDLLREAINTKLK
jgi:CheY-like chemotaxis protein